MGRSHQFVPPAKWKCKCGATNDKIMFKCEKCKKPEVPASSHKEKMTECEMCFEKLDDENPNIRL